MRNMTASLVTPGSIIAKEGEHEHGEGTALANGHIVSTVVGYVHLGNGTISVNPTKAIVEPEIGDTVLCEVVKLNEKNGLDYKKVNLLHLPSNVFFRVNGKPYVLRFDDYETIAAVEALAAIEGLTEDEQVLHIEITPRLPREASTVRLYNVKHSIDLKKAVFKP